MYTVHLITGHAINIINCLLFREAAKKSSPSSLMAVEILERWKKGSKKVLFSLMARPLREKPFFAASLTQNRDRSIYK